MSAEPNGHELQERANRLEAELVSRLRPLTEAEYQEVLAEHVRGESLELADAFAAVAGVSREEWLRRVAEHRAKHSGQREATP